MNRCRSLTDSIQLTFKLNRPMRSIEIEILTQDGQPFAELGAKSEPTADPNRSEGGMDFDQIDKQLKGLPFISSGRARSLYGFVVENECRDILELGFAHGKSSCYLAAAVQELGSGSVLTMDNEGSRRREPNIETLLKQTGLSGWVKTVYASRSFTWELMKVIEEATVDRRCRPRFDFCFLDAGHTWDVTGFGFFLVEKLLRPGGWLLFDDLRWTMAGSPNPNVQRQAARVSEKEATTAQVQKVFSLLVETHPDFGNCRIDKGNWGWAQKLVADR